MNVITNIEEQKRNKERVNVYIDNDYAFSLSKEILLKEKINIKDTVDKEKLLKLSVEDNYSKCKNTSLRIIERSYKTEKELRDSLLTKGYDELSINRTVEFLKEYNFINDEQYTKMYIKDKLKNQGKNKIKYSLIRKGISSDILENELSEVDNSLEDETAYNLGYKKYLTLKKKEDDKYKLSQKLYRFLMSKGYNYDIVSKTIKRITEEE